MNLSVNKFQKAGSIILLPCSIVKLNPKQPRKSFDVKHLDSLTLSVKNNGIIQPLTVRYTENNEYELISGERRLKAAKRAGLSTVPCIIMNINDAESLLYSITENIQRNDLNFFEEADAYKILMDVFGLSQDEISKKIGKSQPYISNKIRLLKLSSEIRELIIENLLTERHGRALLKISDEKLRVKALLNIIKKNLNVNETENYIELLVSPVEPIRTQPKFKKLKDIKIFINTINHAVDTMRKAGINAVSSENETSDYYEYVVRIPKMTSSPVSSGEAV